MKTFIGIRRAAIAAYDRFAGAMYWRMRDGEAVQEGEIPLHAELFGVAEMEKHAKITAAGHEAAVTRGPEVLLRRLNENERVIRTSYRTVAQGFRLGHSLSPAAEWLLDNHHVIVEQTELARLHLPPGYSRELPRLLQGPLTGYPRVYDLVLELVSHTDGRVDIDNLAHFVEAYQSVQQLNLSELWAIAIMLRLTLLENLRGVAYRIAWRQRQSDAALAWAARFLKAAQVDQQLLIAELAVFTKAHPRMTLPLVADLSASLEGVHAATGLVTHWLEHESAQRGQTLEMIQQKESHDQALDAISIRNSITSLRAMNVIDWKAFVESQSSTEAVLRRDPAGIYQQMDFLTRDRYRHVVETIARRSATREEDVAQAAVQLAKERGGAAARPSQDHVGFFLIDEGRLELERQTGFSPPLAQRARRFLGHWPLAAYLFCATALTGILAAPFLLEVSNRFHGPWAGACMALVALIVVTAVSRPALALVNWMGTLLAPPRTLPRMDFSEGLPNDHRAVVVIPTMLESPAQAQDLIEQLEVRFLANRVPNLSFALLTDWPDAAQECLPGDQICVDAAGESIRRLNALYAPQGPSVFFLFHRSRQWNAAEGLWMGHERKRGKLEQFNRLLLEGCAGSFVVIEGDTRDLQDVRYVITLDTDTQLPPGAAWKMVGTMAHPLNRPRLNPATRVVEAGYGVLQPRLAVSLPSANRSRFARLIAGEVGLDPYTREVSNVYHDLFGQGQYLGKGIYDLRAFHSATDSRFPLNRVLSHDLIEGCYARCGFLNDVELIEEQPASYLADVKRRRRWIRGDWQIACWMFGKAPGPDGQTASNSLGVQARWMIFDNLRRSLVEPALLAALLVWPLWTLSLLVVLLLPRLARTLGALLRKEKTAGWGPHLQRSISAELRQWLIELLELVFLPHQTTIALDSIGRVFWRLFASHRHLLEWETAAHAERGPAVSLGATCRSMWTAPGLALTALPLLAFFGWPGWSLVLAGGWLLSPVIAWWISTPISKPVITFSPAQTIFLRTLARRTWAYFEHFAVSEHNWLPPDNVQDNQNPSVADRTSPTNLGMGLLSGLAACDLGYLTFGRMLERTSLTLASMERMERYRGHFYNWYSTRTLRPLRPLYVSTVDSGNLSALLIVLRAGLLELAQEPILPPQWRQGLADTAAILLEECPAAMRDAVQQVLHTQMQAVTATPDDPAQIRRALQGCNESLALLQPTVEAENELVFWLFSLRRQCQALLEEIDFLMPWLAGRTSRNLAAQQSPQPAGCVGAGVPRLHDLAPCSSRAAQRLAQLEELALRCAELSAIDYDFLYDPKRKLLAIGFDLENHRPDSGLYDMLASESRLGSFVGIARGFVPLEHWFHLGRKLASVDAPPVLLSWSGSLFEYLMPLLVMPSFDGTLLDESCHAAVQHQIRYGRRLGIPWGFSESGYNQVDVQMLYQYRAFGVPGLGLKRDLANDRVVAPYAGVMGLIVAPKEASRNLERLPAYGIVGRYGLYEAIDFTPARLPPGKRYAVVQSYMAHHSGMSLLALDSVLSDKPMQRRFLADPHMRAMIVLLQEKVPVARSHWRSDVDVEENVGRGTGGQVRESATRRFETANTAVPALHLLSNGKYHSMITNAGSGYSRWENLAVTRWREDMSRDDHGIFFYLRDVDSGAVWSAVHQPTCKQFDHYEVTFSQGLAEFRSVKNQIEVRSRMAVSPEDDVEVRQLEIRNLSSRERTLEITSYAEVVLLDTQAEAAHPAFHSLFVQPAAVEEKAVLVYTRRARSPEDHWPWFFHTMAVVEGHADGPASFEMEREAFIGRGRSLDSPAALDRSGPLPSRQGTVLDSIASIRYCIRLVPEQRVTINAIFGVGESRAAVDSLIDHYQDHRMAERVFELAWTHSQGLLHQLRATETDAQDFDRIAESIVYAGPQRRCSSSMIARNLKSQPALWLYGISGDLPIVLLRIVDIANLELARKVIQAHTHWRQNGLQTELVIWAEDYTGYRQSLLDEIVALAQGSSEAKILDQPGGIFVRSIDHVPEDDRVLIQAVARTIISDRFGDLAEQTERRMLPEVELPRLEPTRKAHEPATDEAVVPDRNLVFFNGWGGFTQDGREYVIRIEPGNPTPAPWVNVLANPTFGSVISESGGAYTWYQNAHSFRLTPWHNDPVGDTSGEAYYIRDDETGRFWSASALPAPGRTPYVCRHGHGYSAFEHTEDGLFSELYTFVAVDAPLRYTTVTLRNLTNRPRRVSVTGYCEWVLGQTREQDAMHVVTHLNPWSGGVMARNEFTAGATRRVAFFHSAHPHRSLTGDRTEFLGRNSSPRNPAAMSRSSLSNRCGAGLDPCAAIQLYVDLPPRSERRVGFVLGGADSEQDVPSLLRQRGGLDGAQQSLEAVWEFWKNRLGGVYVETPDPAVDFLVNHWLLYQVLSSRFFGRTGYYQSGGAWGFRDQLQDALAFLHECPWLARQHLLLCAGRQFRQGDVQHWWHPSDGRGVRTRISDDLLWLPYVTCRYVETSGDSGVLDEQVGFIEGRPLNEGEESYFDQPRHSEQKGTLYEHCALAIRSRLRFGEHGLPLMGSGDWNDGMNRVGHEGKGESVWLGFFLYDVLERFAKVAQRRNDSDFAAQCLAVAHDLRRKLEAHGWDGQWYLRAFFDDGTPLGSSRNEECQIDAIAQCWAALSGSADPVRVEAALDAVQERLVDRDHRLIRLLRPPFDAASWDPGYIRGYVPGVRENGGQYTHAAVWTALAAAVRRRPEHAWELFQFINPINHGDTRERIQTYKVEPYVVAGDVYTATGHEGRGGWTWYTGAAGWMYQLLVEHLLGVKLEGETLRLEPLFPPEWQEFALHYRYRATVYHIRVCKTGSQTWQIARLLVDDVEQPDKRVHLIDDGREHHVHVEAGPA